MSAAQDTFWNLLAKLDERAEAAEALAERRGRALQAIKNSVSKGEMRRIAIQAAPAEAQARQEEDSHD